MEDFVRQLCVCVFGRGCQVVLTIVLFLLIGCATQMGEYLSHKLSFCGRKDMKMEAITPKEQSADRLLKQSGVSLWLSDVNG